MMAYGGLSPVLLWRSIAGLEVDAAQLLEQLRRRPTHPRGARGHAPHPVEVLLVLEEAVGEPALLHRCTRVADEDPGGLAQLDAVAQQAAQGAEARVLVAVQQRHDQPGRARGVRTRQADQGGLALKRHEGVLVAAVEEVRDLLEAVVAAVQVVGQPSL